MADPAQGTSTPPSPTDTDPSVRTIPLFPLATVVLLPAVRVPLFIFEPRYRQMTRAALSDERLIGMCTVLPEGRVAMEGDPEIYPVGCLGHIEHAKERPDGTWDIVLEGLARFEVERELEKPEGRLFREARVRLLEEETAPKADVTRLRAEVHRSYGDVLALLAPQNVEAFEAQNFDAISDDVYANTISLSLDIDPVEKQSLLESSGVLSRLERVLALLEFQLAESKVRNATNPKTLQ